MILRDIRQLFCIIFYIKKYKPQLIYCDSANVVIAYFLKRFLKYSNFSNLESYKDMKEDSDLLYCKMYCEDLYNYIKNNFKKSN